MGRMPGIDAYTRLYWGKINTLFLTEDILHISLYRANIGYCMRLGMLCIRLVAASHSN